MFLSAGPVGGRLGAGWGGGPFGQHVCVHACVCAGVCREPGRTGPLGELGAAGRNTISKADTALEAVSSFGETQDSPGSLLRGLGWEQGTCVCSKRP